MLRRCAALAAFLWAPALCAQSSPSLGEQHYRAGVDAYSRGEYHAAAIEFRAAFELTGEPQLQFNLGNALAADRQRDAACQAFRSYVAALPDAPNRLAADARVRELCASSTAVAPPDTTHTSTPAGVNPPDTGRLPEQVAPRVVEPVVRSPWPTVGIVTGATGLAATLVGVGLWVDVSSQHDACIAAGWCAAEDKPLSENDIAAGLVYGGAALAVAGLVTWLVAPRTQRSHAPTAWLVAQPGALGVGGVF